nr:MAG TPA: hypothetical protein [Caudoviricetes sp.]
MKKKATIKPYKEQTANVFLLITFADTIQNRKL